MEFKGDCRFIVEDSVKFNGVRFARNIVQNISEVFYVQNGSLSFEVKNHFSIHLLFKIKKELQFSKFQRRRFLFDSFYYFR